MKVKELYRWKEDAQQKSESVTKENVKVNIFKGSVITLCRTVS